MGPPRRVGGGVKTALLDGRPRNRRGVGSVPPPTALWRESVPPPYPTRGVSTPPPALRRRLVPPYGTDPAPKKPSGMQYFWDAHTHRNNKTMESSIFEIRNRISVATPAQPCDGHVETKSDAPGLWMVTLNESQCELGRRLEVVRRPVYRRLSPKSIVTVYFLSQLWPNKIWRWSIHQNRLQLQYLNM